MLDRIPEAPVSGRYAVIRIPESTVIDVAGEVGIRLRIAPRPSPNASVARSRPSSPGGSATGPAASRGRQMRRARDGLPRWTRWRWSPARWRCLPVLGPVDGPPGASPLSSGSVTPRWRTSGGSGGSCRRSRWGSAGYRAGPGRGARGGGRRLRRFGRAGACAAGRTRGPAVVRVGGRSARCRAAPGASRSGPGPLPCHAPSTVRRCDGATGRRRWPVRRRSSTPPRTAARSAGLSETDLFCR